MWNGALLSKDEVIRCYALCRQAERSVDRALQPSSWPDFVAYYYPSRVGTIEQIVARLREKLSPAFTYPDEGKGRKYLFPFREQQVRAIIAALDGFLSLLRRADGPDQQELIAVRKALFDCEYAMEPLLRRLPEYHQALRIHHFLFPTHLESVTLEELVGETKLEQATRQDQP
jgi:hypothetical protein